MSDMLLQLCVYCYTPVTPAGRTPAAPRSGGGAGRWQMAAAVRAGQKRTLGRAAADARRRSAEFLRANSDCGPGKKIAGGVE